jgi:hypothetical protein
MRKGQLLRLHLQLKAGIQGEGGRGGNGSSAVIVAATKLHIFDLQRYTPDPGNKGKSPISSAIFSKFILK